MAKKRVADLHAALALDVGAWESGAKKAARGMRDLESFVTRSLSGMAAKGAKFGLGFFGAESAAKLLEKEIKHVVGNLDKIPGMTPEQIASVRQFEGVVASAKSTLDSMVASSLAGTVAVAEALRVQMDTVRFGEEEAKRLQSERIAAAKQAVAESPENVKKLTEAKRDLASAEAELAQVGESRAATITRLRKEAEAMKEGVGSKDDNDPSKVEALADATRKQTAAEEQYLKLKEDVAKAESEAGAALQFYSGVALTGRESVEALSQAVATLQYELSTLTGDSPEIMEMRLKKLEELRKRATALEKATERVDEVARELGMTFSSAFEDAIVDGEKLSDLLRGLAKDVARLFLREQVTKPGAAMLTDFFKGMFRADGGPVTGGQPYIVGERGPELMVPNSAGTVVPNHALRSGVAAAPSQVFNLTYNFATGVTRQEIAGLIPHLVESSKRAVLNAVNRGGTARQAFA